ncbi:proline-rich protein 36-like isoform X2 [Amphibalanus amphitrite]|uniref:proline-rich protein 36-like isoform X2 n=1 Tax=Amphibalanus amphitrite TaxID=1232801 RepID=UPI001C913FD3|nr:proline-rich protein 36-like isoform X2 [Amphibalanus amphitrite]
MSVVASDILFVRGDGGYRPGLTSPVASLDLVKQTGGPHSSSTVSSKDSAVFDEFHHSPRWLAKNRHNAQKAAKYKQLFGSQPRPDGPASSGTPPVSGLTSVTPVSGPAGQTGSGGRRPPLPAARSSLSSITSLILGTNRFRQRSAKANHRSTTVLNTAKEAVNHTSTTIITGSPVPGGGRSETAPDAPSPIKGDRRPPTWIEKALRADAATPSQLPAPLRLGRQSEPAQRLGDVTGHRDVVTDDVKGRPPRPGRPARISLVTVSAAEQAAAATQQSASERGDSASGVGAASGPQTDAGSVPVAPPRRRRPTGRLTSSVGDLLDSGERRPRLVPHGVPTATTRLTIPLSGLRGPPAAPAGTHSRPEPDSSHDSSLRGHDSAAPTAPRPQPRRHSKSTGSLLFAGETPGSPPRAAPRALKFSIGRALTEHGARTSVQLTSDGASETQPERQSRQEPRPESKRPSEPEQEPDRTPPSLFERTGELKSGSRASIRVQSPPRQPVTSLPEPRSAELETDSSSADGSDSPPSLRRVLSPLSADSVSDLSAAAGSERRTYRSRRPVSTTASPATPLLSSQDRRRPQSAFNARRTIAHRRQAEAAARSASEPRRRHTATWVTGKINVSVTSVGRAASLTQLGAGGGTRALTVSDRSSSSPTLEQEKRDIRRYLYCTNLTSGDQSPERERRLSESCLRLGAPAAGDELPERPADPRLLSPDSIGSCWSAVTADVLTVRDTADERSDVTGDRCDVFGGRTDAAMTLETEDERPPSSISTAASTGPRRRLSTSVVHLWGPDESHLLPSGPSSLPSTRPARPHSLSSSTLLGGTDQQPSWLPRSQERRSLRDGLKGDAWSRTADPAQSPTTLLTASVGQPAAGLANGQPAEPRLSSESRPPAGGHGPRPAPLDLSANADVELSSEVPPEPPSCPPPDSPTESPCDLPPPPPSQPPPDSPPDSPPPLPSVPPPESPTDSGPEPLWTSRFERPRRQSLSTSLPSFATVPVVSDGSASVGRKPPSVAPSLWSDSPAAPIGRPAARRPLRPAGLASDAGRGPSSLPAVTPDSGAGAADCTAQWTGAGGGAAAAPADRHTVQVRVARPEHSPETAGSAQRRRASTGVYLNGAAPAAESRTQTSFTISLGGARKRPSLFSQRSSPSLLSTSQPASLPTLSSKSPTSPPPAKQPLSLSGLRAARRPLSTPAVQAPPATASDRQPVSLPGLFDARQPTPSAQREPTSLPAATRLPKSPPPSRSQPSLPKSPPPSRPPPSLPKSPPPSRSPPRSPAASRTEDSRRGSSELQRQLEDDWARMERRHQAFLRHTAQQRGQPAPRSILKKQSAPSLLESVASESRPGWERAEQPRRRASNVNWHDLERTKQQIRSEIERMKRQLRSEMGGSGSRAGPWPPRPAASSAASATSSTSGRTVVETIHAIHIERDSSPGLVITEVDDADDAASNHSGVVIEEIFDDELDAAAPAGDADSLPRPAAQERSHPGPAVSEPQPQPSPSPWWRTPVAAASAATETSHLPGWRRPTQPATAVSGAESRLLHSAGSVSERPVSGGGLSDGERQHVQVEQLSATSVSGEQQRDLSMTHFRHLYVDKMKTVHIGTADGESTAPDETRHYHSVAAVGASVTSRVVTPGGDLRTTFSTSTTSGTSPGRPRSPAPGRRPASAAPRPDYLSHSSRPSKSVHGCSITVQEFIV